MTFNFCDGFDSYGATADLTKKWRTAQTPWVWGSTLGRFGGGGVQAATTGGGVLNTQLAASNTAAPAAGFHVKISAKPSATATLFAGFDNGASINAEIKIDTNGFPVCAVRGSVAPALPAPINLCDNAWHWFEFNVSTAAGNNTFSVWVDGISCGTTVIFASQSNIFFWQFTSMAGLTVTIDDCIFFDRSGGTFTTSPMGPRLITTLRPTADGVCTFATLSAGTSHNALVKEANPDGDTSYVEDGTSGNQDLLTCAALSYNPSSVSAMVVNTYVKTGVPGTINNQAACKSNVTTAVGPSVLTPGSYLTQQGAFPTDPNGGIAWTQTSINAAQYGYKNV